MLENDPETLLSPRFAAFWGVRGAFGGLWVRYRWVKRDLVCVREHPRFSKVEGSGDPQVPAGNVILGPWTPAGEILDTTQDEVENMPENMNYIWDERATVRQAPMSSDSKKSGMAAGRAVECLICKATTATSTVGGRD